MRRSIIALTLLGSFAAPLAHAVATEISGSTWVLRGNAPQNYRSGVDTDGTSFLASKAGVGGDGFGTIMQDMKADKFAGKRLRLRAWVRSEDVKGWAGLWMRVDKGTKAVAFDNMQDRPIKGTSWWKTYDVVLDVPSDATAVSFGTLVANQGEVWLDHVTLEVVSPDTP